MNDLKQKFVQKFYPGNARYLVKLNDWAFSSRWFRESTLARKLFLRSYFLYKKFLEDPFDGFMKRHASRLADGDMLDVGACIGYTSVVFAGHLRSGRKVHAFEPDLNNFKIFTELVLTRELGGKVIPNCSAVGASEGAVEFWHNPMHHGDHRVMSTSLSQSLWDRSEIRQVPLISLDTYVKKNAVDRVSFIKIDVQGYEMEVCKGMSGILDQYPDVVVAVEYSPLFIGEFSAASDEMIRFFENKKFKIYELHKNGRLTGFDFQKDKSRLQKRGYVDLICLRNSL